MCDSSVQRLIFGIFAGVIAALPATAGVVVVPPVTDTYHCEAVCQSLIKDWVVEDVRRFVPNNLEPPVRFDSPAVQEACSASRDATATVHAVVLAPYYRDFVELPGTQNDARLLKSYFRDRGVKPQFITVADGDQVTREKMIAVMTDTLRCVRERDQVVIVFTGGATSYGRWIAPKDDEFTELICAPDDKSEEVRAFCDSLGDLDEVARKTIVDTYRQTVEDHDELVLFSSDVNLHTQALRTTRETRVVGLGAFELANFVTQVRNRGADAFVLLDTNFAAAARLLQLERDAVGDGGWFWDTGKDNEPAETDVNPHLVPLFGSGHFAAYYATNESEIARESPMGEDRLILGRFMFTFAETLRQQPDIPLTKLAVEVNRAVRDNYTGYTGQTPVFEASSTSLRFLTPSAAPANSGADIEIISPSPKRGAAGIEDTSFTLVARYAGKAKAYKAIVDGEIVSVDKNGQFRRDIADASGKFTIPIRVLSSDFSTLAAIEVKLREKDDQPVIATAARRLALVIANQTYADAAFPALKTPAADAEAMVAVLTSRFGFETEISGGGTTINLFLKDAGKAQIQQALFDLRQRLTPEDQLLVYYAGHGENDPDLGAFWVPVDGLPKVDFTWIAAEEITRELKRMNAASVLVISDSCYAGGLSRGAKDTPEVAESRARYLAKASRMKARQLMASGGEEPVEDGGGGGHSVFAKALIDALQTMPDKTFTASELFEQKVKPAVISAANALTEGQTPGFSRIARAGDEPGSEFVFQAAE